jgi:predicted amidohydrolase YtcJ
MRFRAYLLVVPDLLADLQRAGVRPRLGDGRLRIGGVKLFCDGSASERTMRTSKPYVGLSRRTGRVRIAASEGQSQRAFLAEANAARGSREESQRGL